MDPVTSKIELVPDGKLFFLHIPKTAGTSLVSLLDNFFEQKEICQAYSNVDLVQIPIPQLKKYRFFRGHIGLDTLEKALGEKPRTITLLRHPVGHALSIFAYWRRRTDQEFLVDEVRKFRLITMDRYIHDPWMMHTRDYRNFQIRNLLTRIEPSRFELENAVEALPPYILDPNKLNSQTAITLIKDFEFAGLVERFQDSMLLLSYTMGWQPPEHVPYLNKGANRSEQNNISQRLYDRITEGSSIDMELYEATRQLFEQRFEAMTFDLLQRYATPAQARLKYPLPAEELFDLLEKHYRKSFIERNKPVSTLRYDLDQPLSGRQWHERNLNPEHGVTRWSGPGPVSTLDLPLAAKDDLKVNFRVLAAMTGEVLDSLKLDVEGQDIPLTRQVNPNSSTNFEGLIPRALLEKSAGLTRLNFRLKHTVVAEMVDPGNKDPRQLGINLNRVEIYPASQPAASPVSQVLPTISTPGSALPSPVTLPNQPILGNMATVGKLITAARTISRPHLMVIADVSNAETYHLGDEAMLEANLDKFRELWPDLTLSVISNDPKWTARQYKVAALNPFGFTGGEGEREAGQREKLLQTLIEAAQQKLDGQPLTPGRPGQQIIETLDQVDAVVVSGGGNLCSNWPGHIYERAALVRLAQLFGKPSFVFGQTLGPNLSLRERQLVQETLHQTKLIGLREKNSLALAQSLGISQDKITYQLDDAFYLKPRPNPAWAEQLSLSRLTTMPLILVTLAPFVEFENNPALLSSLAEQLEEIAFDCGAGLVLVPHLARALDNPGLSDVSLHTQLMRTFKPGTAVLNLNTGLGGEVRWLTEKADMVISMRYHPLVFAMAAGKPGLGIYTDNYTKVKLRGALGHAGLEDWSMPIEVAVGSGLAKGAKELWKRRAALSEHITGLQPEWKLADQYRWQRFRIMLGSQNAKFLAGEKGSASSPNQPSPQISPLVTLQPGPATLRPTGGWFQATKLFDRQINPISPPAELGTNKQVTGKMSIISIEEVRKTALNPAHFLGGNIDVPTAGTLTDYYVLEIAGWWVVKDNRPCKIEVLYQGSIQAQSSPNVVRQDVTDHFTPQPIPEKSGFSLMINTTHFSPGFELVVELVLEEGQRINWATIRGRQQPLSPSFKPGIQALMLYGPGRSGTTLVMQLLGLHPEIVVEQHFPYETRNSLYWLHQARVLSAPSTR